MGRAIILIDEQFLPVRGGDAASLIPCRSSVILSGAKVKTVISNAITFYPSVAVVIESPTLPETEDGSRLPEIELLFGNNIGRNLITYDVPQSLVEDIIHAADAKVCEEQLLRYIPSQRLVDLADRKQRGCLTPIETLAFMVLQGDEMGESAIRPFLDKLQDDA